MSDLPQQDEPVGPDWSRLRAALDVTLAQGLEDVVRWEWQPLGLLLESPRPFRFERHGDSPSKRRVNWEPRNEQEAVQYGWGRDDGLRVARRFSRWGDELLSRADTVVTTAFHDDGDVLDIAHERNPRGDHRLVLRSVTRMYRDGKLLTGLITWFDDPSNLPRWVRESYEFDDAGHVVVIRIERCLDESHREVERGEPRRQRSRLVAERDSRGDLVCLRREEITADGVPSADRELLWQRSNAEQRRSAEAFLQAQLPVAICAWTARVKTNSPAYCLAISYGDTWSPALGIATVDELATWGPPGSSSRGEMLWNPAEFACFDPEPSELNTPTFADAYRTAAQGWGDRTPEKVRALCLAAATRAPELGIHLTKADAFVVYATDLELMDLDANFRKLKRTRERRAIEALHPQA